MANFEMKTLPSSDDIDGAPVSHTKMAGNKVCVANMNPDAVETDSCLAQQSNGTNGALASSVHEVRVQMNGNNPTHTEESTMCRIKEELNKRVFWKIRLWMVIIFMLFVIIAVILISLAVCAAIHEDEDDKFDLSSFTVPLYLIGSFQMPNQVFTVELSTISSNKSVALATELQTKMSDHYKSSPALGRYFSTAEIYAFRNGSVIADYKLTFLMPEEEKDELRNFTLSREMVYNVFRQFLYDQDPLESGGLFIDPVSLKMLSGH